MKNFIEVEAVSADGGMYDACLDVDAIVMFRPIVRKNDTPLTHVYLNGREKGITVMMDYDSFKRRIGMVDDQTE